MGLSETERAVGYLVKRVQQSLRRRSDDALRSTGVSMAQYAVLFARSPIIPMRQHRNCRGCAS